MGISLPDLPPSNAEDNVNLGEKDSIRRRALWALEGKPDLSYSKVEIPELSTPQTEKFVSEFRMYLSVIYHLYHSYHVASKPSFPPGSGMISHLPNKRDSFKLLSSASSAKDQLHTLMEEEEEEEEGVPSSVNDPKATELLPSPAQTSHGPPLKPTSVRPRPASLNLRPLSLTPESLSVTTAQGPPTMPTGWGGLKSLSLSSATHVDSSDLSRNYESNRRAFTFPLRARLSGDGTSPPTDDSKPRRRSSISYKKSSGVTINYAGLPTPEATPSYQDRHFSLSEPIKSSSEDEFFPPKATPLSAGEQHFLVKSHNALLARITDLERTLSMRASSGISYHRSLTSLSSDVSCSSDQTGTTLGDPDDEMLQLIADLKAERDEYKKDVDAWRGRVNEMDKKLMLMSKLVEAERRDAWIARSKVGLMEIEKASMEKKLEGNEALLNTAQEEKKALELQNQKLQDEIARVRADLIQVKQQLDKAQQEMESKAMHLVLTANSSEDDNCLAEYEDGDSDVSFQTSSPDSADEHSLSETVFRLNRLVPNVRSAPETIQGRSSKHTLSKLWTFPNGPKTVVDSCRINPDVDSFFGCLEDVQDGTNILLPSDPAEYSYERSKGLFADALKSYNDDQDAPFIFPGDIHIEADGAGIQSREESLAVLEGEDQVLSDVNMFGQAGGISITLTPAQDDDECEDQDEDINFFTSQSKPPVLPPLDFNHSVEDLSGALSFGFSNCDVFETFPTDSRSPTPKAELVNPMSPSFIPQPKPCQNSASDRSATPEESVQDPYFTPPSKRGRVSPSLIPQAIASPSPIRLASIFPRPRLYALTSSCPPQHIQRSSAGSAHKSSSSVTNGSTSLPQPCILRWRS